MKFNILVFTFVLIQCFSTNAQTSFNFAHASQLAQQGTQGLNQLNAIYSSPFKKCQKIENTSGDSVAECSIKGADYDTPIVKIDYDSAQALPESLKASLPDKFMQDTENQKLSCVFRFKISNDNLQLPGQKRDPNKQPIGDDRGNTHGSEVGVSCLSADGKTSAFTYSTDLYTDPDYKTRRWQENGNVGLKQKFTAENVFSFVQDNINQGKATYWKRGVGFVNLSQKKKWGLLQADGQQQWYHDIMNHMQKGTAYEYQNIEGSMDKWAGFVILSIGLQENRKLGKNCSVHFNADAGVRLATRADSSMINGNAEIKFNYQMTDNYIAYMRAQSEVKVRNSSTVVENTLAAGVQSQQGGFIEAGVMSQTGNRKDVQDLKNVHNPKKNDLMYFMRLGKAI